MARPAGKGAGRIEWDAVKADAHGIYFTLPHNGSARAAHAWRWCQHAVWQGPEGDAWGEMLRGVRAGEGFFLNLQHTTKRHRLMSTPHLVEVTLPPRLRTTVCLPGSKSLSNRALLLDALAGRGGGVRHVSQCDDTDVMLAALDSLPEVIDIGAAGTAMRFLTAFLAATPCGTHLLTGTQRMQERPIGVLVEALRTLGAEIDYAGREGFPPLRITGRTLAGGHISIPASVSSQYISALLMTGPVLRHGLTLTLTGSIISRPYIDMTLTLMRHYGASVQWTDAHTLHAEGGGYRSGTVYDVEADWSAASYWYEMVALSPDANAMVHLPRLYADSAQGDAAVARLFEPLGVATRFEPEGGVTLTKACSAPCVDVPYVHDLTSQPDLAQTLVVTCAMLRKPFRLTGLRTLRIKETDRMAALQAELAKFGVALQAEGDEALYVEHYAPDAPRYDGRPIATYHDHRMAMAFAPAALVCGPVTISHAEVVSKSYPTYWQHLRALGGVGEP